MSDDENFVADRRGIKRAHESPQKINSLFEDQALDVGDECSIESDDYPEDWNEHFHNKTAEAETPQLEEEEADPEIIYPEHKQHHLEKAAFYFRELLADDKEIITKYKEQIAAFRIAKAWRGCVILGFFVEFHVDRNPNTQKDVVLIEGVVPSLRTHVKHCTTIETILHLRIVATLI